MNRQYKVIEVTYTENWSKFLLSGIDERLDSIYLYFRDGEILPKWELGTTVTATAATPVAWSPEPETQAEPEEFLLITKETVAAMYGTKDEETELLNGSPHTPDSEAENEIR